MSEYVSIAIALGSSVLGFVITKLTVLTKHQLEIGQTKERVEKLENYIFQDLSKKVEEINKSLAVLVEKVKNIEHHTKKPVHIDQGDLETLLELIAQVQQKGK